MFSIEETFVAITAERVIPPRKKFALSEALKRRK